MKLGGMGWNCVNMGEMVVKAPLRGAGGEAGGLKLGGGILEVCSVN